jgi:hypothetical protein
LGIFKIDVNDNVKYIASGRLGNLGYTKCFWINIKFEFPILLTMFVTKNILETKYEKIKETFGIKVAILSY